MLVAYGPEALDSWEFGLLLSALEPSKKPDIPNKWLRSRQELPWGYQPPWYRYYNPRVGLKEQSYSAAIGLFSSEDSGRHYQTEALLGLYNPDSRTS
ncbi:hypothetical protein EVAR_72151_1, partial [Eumeta japonica]